MFKYAPTYSSWESLTLTPESLSRCKVYGKPEDSFQLIKKHGKYLELGTLKGDYAQKLLDVLDPAELFLLDIFDESVYFGGDFIFEEVTQLEYVKNRFKDNDSVTILKQDISFIADNKILQNKKFDYIYLDIANSYGSFKSQFYTALSFLESDGILGINDYTRNNYDPESTNDVEVFGVIQVINEFLNMNSDWCMIGLVLNPSGYNDVMITRKQDKEIR